MDRFKLRDKKQWYVRPAIASYILKRSDKKNLKGIQMNPDLDKRICSTCDKKVLVITVLPVDDNDSYLQTTGLWVEGFENDSFVLCDDCADNLYKEGRLAYSGSGDAILI